MQRAVPHCMAVVLFGDGSAKYRVLQSHRSCHVACNSGQQLGMARPQRHFFQGASESIYCRYGVCERPTRACSTNWPVGTSGVPGRQPFTVRWRASSTKCLGRCRMSSQSRSTLPSSGPTPACGLLGPLMSNVSAHIAGHR